MKKSNLIVTLVVLTIVSSLPAVAGGVDRMIIVPEKWQGAYDFGYAPAIRVGEWVVISGIPASGEGTYEDKVRRMYERAEELLTASGATWADVVELTSFHLESKDSAQFGAEFGKYMPIHKEFLGDHRPAWTAVGTTALLSPSAVVETKFVAVVGSGASSRVVRHVDGAEGSGE